MKKSSLLLVLLTVFISCQSRFDLELDSEFHLKAQSDTVDVTDLMIKSKQAYRHSSIKYYQNENFKLFSNGSNGDYFFMDGQGQIDFLFSAVPADSMGNMVFRYDPVSNPILYRGELLYLRMPYYLHKIKNKTYKHDSTSYINIGKYIFDDIITLNGVNLFFHGHKNLPQKVIEEVVSNINLETGKSEMIFTFVGPTTVSNVTSDGKNIFVAHKYTSKIDVYSLNNGKYDSIYLEPSKLRKYKSIEYKKEYLSLPLKEKVAYREDRFLDYKVIQGFHFQLIGYFDRDGNQDDGFYKHLITVNKDGEIKEKALPPNFLNFDNFGNVYSLKKEDGKTYLITTPVLDLMDW